MLDKPLFDPYKALYDVKNSGVIRFAPLFSSCVENDGSTSTNTYFNLQIVSGGWLEYTNYKYGKESREISFEIT